MATPKKVRSYPSTFTTDDGVELDLHPVPCHCGYYATMDGRVISRRRCAQKEIGMCAGPYGHRTVVIDGKSIPVGRIIYATFIGPIPDGIEIDHIDRDPTNNRPGNLRLATRLQNARNNSGHRNTSSQHVGVSFHKRLKKWQARIRFNGRLRYLGSFDTEPQAHESRKASAAELFGEFAPV